MNPDHKKSPFKFLDYYQQQDFEVFFGREQAADDLYHALSGVKLLLVYGPSGSGKTSLVECGLRNQFSDADWYALSIRRGQNMTTSVFARINEALREKIALDPVTGLPTELGIGFGELVENLFSERYRPIYLIFDQFEELLLLGSDEEKDGFFDRLQKLISYKMPCRVLLVMREEFIGHLSEWEARCPSLFEHRFRLEKMNRSNVQSVIEHMLTAESYQTHFRVQEPEALASAILSKLPDTQREIELAHVQVFLEELWHRTVGQTDPDAVPVLHSGLVHVEDNLEGILDKFLKNQLNELAPVYGERTPLELLAALITERHTKLQLTHAEISADLAKKNILLAQPLDVLLTALQQRRILRALKVGEQMRYEISHDVLAKVVGGNLTEEMKLRERAQEAYRVYESRKGLFSQEDLDYLRGFGMYMEMPERLKVRVRESEKTITKQERAQLEAAQKQAEEERKLREEAEKQKVIALRQGKLANRRSKIAAILALVALVGFGIAGGQYVKLEKKQKELEAQTKEANGQKSKADSLRSEAELQSIIAVSKKKEADSLRVVAEKKQKEAEKQRQITERKTIEAQTAFNNANNERQARQKIEIARLLNEADIYRRAGLYKNAQAKWKAVLALDSNNLEIHKKNKK